jgi:hypothetical protein
MFLGLLLTDLHPSFLDLLAGKTPERFDSALGEAMPLHDSKLFITAGIFQGCYHSRN